MQCLLKRCRQKERKKLTITLTLTADQEEMLNCIMASQDEETDPQLLLQKLFNETLNANYIYNSKCGECGGEEYQLITPQESEA